MDINTLYIADTTNNRVVLIQSGSTNATAIIGSLGNGTNQLNSPTDVFVTSAFIYILDGYNYRVQRWTKNGSNGIAAAGTTGVAGNSSSFTNFGYSYGIYVDKYGYLYISDKANSRVLRYPPGSSNGTSSIMVAGTGNSGSAPSELNQPHKVFVDDDLSMYIADAGNHRIQKWTYGACSGITVAGNGTMGNSNSQLNYPVHVIVDANGFMFISERDNHRIIRWLVGSTTGECIAGCSGIAGNRTDKLNNPSAVALDSDGLLYVSDQLNNRVQKFSLISTSGEYSISCDTIFDEVEVLTEKTVSLFSPSDTATLGKVDTIADHRSRIDGGCSRKWIFDDESQSGHAHRRQQHSLHCR